MIALWASRFIVRYREITFFFQWIVDFIDTKADTTRYVREMKIGKSTIKRRKEKEKEVAGETRWRSNDRWDFHGIMVSPEEERLASPQSARSKIRDYDKQEYES